MIVELPEPPDDLLGFVTEGPCECGVHVLEDVVLDEVHADQRLLGQHSEACLACPQRGCQVLAFLDLLLEALSGGDEQRLSVAKNAECDGARDRRCAPGKDAGKGACLDEARVAER